MKRSIAAHAHPCRALVWTTQCRCTNPARYVVIFQLWRSPARVWTCGKHHRALARQLNERNIGTTIKPVVRVSP